MSVPDQPHRPPTLRHLEQLMAELLDGVILMDPTGVLLSANPAALAMHGVRNLEDLGGTAEDYARRFTLWSEGHRTLRRREYPLFRLLAGDSVADTVVEVAPAGETEARWVHEVRDVTMDVDGGEPDYLALVLSDVSQRFDAEARFRAMFQANPAPALVIAQRGLRILRANPGFLALTGFAADQLVGRPLLGFDLLGDLPDMEAMRQAMEAGKVIAQTNAELRVADGQRRLVLFAGQPIDVTGEDALLLTFADLEPRRRAETSLAASERHLQAVFEMAPVPMAVTHATDHRIARVNAEFRELTGHGGDAGLDEIPEASAWWSDARDHEAMRADLDRGSVRDRPVQLLSRSGEVIHCLVSAESIRMQDTPCVLWVLQDVTERRRSEAELGEAIDAVLKDASWLSRSILDRLATLRRPAASAVVIDLSPREREILDLICDDMDDAGIAHRLSISRNTVRNHVARLYAKIGVNRRAGAVVWGRERGMGSRHI